MQKSGSANWRISASCATANERNRPTASQRKSFLTCRARKGKTSEYVERSAKFVAKADANCLPRPRAEDCRRRGLHHHLSERVAEHGIGIESRVCVQCRRVVRWRALCENLPLNGTVWHAIPNRRYESATLTSRSHGRKSFTRAARSIACSAAPPARERRKLCFGRRYVRRAMFPDRIRYCYGGRIRNWNRHCWRIFAATCRGVSIRVTTNRSMLLRGLTVRRPGSATAAMKTTFTNIRARSTCSS